MDLPPAYEPHNAPPPYADDTAGGNDNIALAQVDNAPSAPPAYEVKNNFNEGGNTEPNIPMAQPAAPIIEDLTDQLPQRNIYVLKLRNEPTPKISIITPDQLDKYKNEEIVPDFVPFGCFDRVFSKMFHVTIY